MNETNHTDSASDVLWLTSDRRARVSADGAAPEVRQLGESASEAEDALRAKTDRLGDTRDEWVESVRTKVRGSPLVAVAAAVTLGAVIARIAR